MVYASSFHTAVQPPLGTTTALNFPANPSPQERKEESCCCYCLAYLGLCAFFIAALIVFVAILCLVSIHDTVDSVGGLPVVKIGYVTVSLRNDSTNPPNTSEWNIAFTIENQKPGATLVYENFNVSIQSVAWRSTVGIVPGFRQNSTEVAHFNTTVRALMPRFNDELQFGVTFLSMVIEETLSEKEYKTANALFNGTCTDMKIAVQGTYGIAGGPVTCLDPHEGSDKYGYIF